MANIHIIDDDKIFCNILSLAIKRLGHTPTFSLTLKEGLEAVFCGQFDVVMLDVKLPDGNGLEAIPKIREKPSPPEVIILTGFGDPNGAELAIECGAWDYIEKPASAVGITLPMVRALEYRKEKQEKKTSTNLDRKGVVGDSPKLTACLELLAQAAGSDVNVLVTGETGTGKELLAATIHKNSPRAKCSFVIVDCGALPDTLIESLLFGYEKGAFTGATSNNSGLIKQADGGTLFLDEVGELPMTIQKAFLRVLQERRFRPIGGKKEETSNFRLVSATNRDLDLMVREGKFREDLLYRIRAFTVASPPLRQRREDIKDLVLHHLSLFCEKSQITMKGFSPNFFEALRAYNWPGNIRELFNTMESAVLGAGEEPILYPYHLPTQIRAQVAKKSLKKNSPADVAEMVPVENKPGAVSPISPFKDYRAKLLEDGERQYFAQIITQADGDIKNACTLSGLSRSRLYHFLQKHGLSLLGDA